MTKVGLDQYKGVLTAAETAAGMNAARRNAERLARDARLLLENRRYPSALAMGVLSIEESGKVSILRGLALISDPEEIKKEWKAYRSHRSKNTMWILPQLIVEGRRTLDELRAAADRTGDHTMLLDQVKQVAVYTDCCGDKHWSKPDEVIDEKFARHIVTTAEFLAGVGKRASKEATVREIELWVEHMGPVIGKPMAEMKVGLGCWWGAMRDEGLAESCELNFEEFVSALGAVE